MVKYVKRENIEGNFMKETELYLPIKLHLESLGYFVQGEVQSIDVFAMKGEHSVAIELKTQISLKLIYQAIERQKIADEVYIAIPRQAVKSHREHMKSLMSLLKRLSVGLLVVEGDEVIQMLDTSGSHLSLGIKRNTKKRKRTLHEFKNRELDVNIGGTKGKSITLYRETSIKIAKIIDSYGALSPKDIKAFTQIDHVDSILQKNYYGWFVRIRRGIYTLSDHGREDLRTYE